MGEVRQDRLWILESGFKDHKAYKTYLKKHFHLKVFDDLESLGMALQSDTDIPHLILLRPPKYALLPDLGVRSKLEWDPLSRKIGLRGEHPIVLTNREFQIFSALLDARDCKMSRRMLVSAVWSDIRVGVKTLDVHLFNLRKKLDQVGFEIVFSPPDTFILKK